jgi:hypothetical protein
MLYVTDRALTALGAMRVASDAEESETILLYLEEDGSLGLALAELEEGDNVIEHEGQVVVIVAEDLARALDGMTLDVEVSENGEEVEFVIVDEDEIGVDEGNDPFRADGADPESPPI